jgi:hypothetical protein
MSQKICCMVCAEDSTATRNPMVSCPYASCGFSACRKCCQRYILDQRVSKCMNGECGREWDRKFVVETFAKTFVTNDWKKMREQVLYDREKALLPATQGIVESRIRQEKTKDDIRQIDILMRELMARRHNLEVQYRIGNHGNANPVHDRRQFIRACPADDCRGFLSTQWKCGTCAKSTCPECHELKHDHDILHVCNPDNVATAILLSKDTKPCPKCATGIFKIEGCDQMWCTQCHTAFSWRSGFIETNIHNPHFYEWQRRNNNGVAPRVVGDVPCAHREINHMTPGNLTALIKTKLNIVAGTAEQDQFAMLMRRIYRICESIHHLVMVQIDFYRNAGNREENNMELRVDYLRNKISEEDFKIKVQRANKQHEKKREMAEVLTLFVTTVSEIVYGIHGYISEMESVHTNKGKVLIAEKIGERLDEVEAIRTYANECLASIAATYGSKAKTLVMFDPIIHRIVGDRSVLI